MKLSRSRPPPEPYVYPAGSFNIKLDDIPEVTSIPDSEPEPKSEPEPPLKSKAPPKKARGNLCCYVVIGIVSVTLFGGITVAPILTAVLQSTTSSTSSVNMNLSSTHSSSSGTTLTVTSATTTTSLCSAMICSFSTIVNPLTMFVGAARLNINCTQSVSAMLIQIIIQRSVGATFANQYQTFWNMTTNQTFTQSISQIIYTWTVIPGQIVQGLNFPYYVEGQFSLPNANHVTSFDRYSAQLTSVCGHTVTGNGTF